MLSICSTVHMQQWTKHLLLQKLNGTYAKKNLKDTILFTMTHCDEFGIQGICSLKIERTKNSSPSGPHMSLTVQMTAALYAFFVAELKLLMGLAMFGLGSQENEFSSCSSRIYEHGQARKHSWWWTWIHPEQFTHYYHWDLNAARIELANTLETFVQVGIKMNHTVTHSLIKIFFWANWAGALCRFIIVEKNKYLQDWSWN